jgi:signal recognition particle GTPase
MLAGLQGSGKTTNSAKLARWFKSQGRQPLMVGADLVRAEGREPAAFIRMLRVCYGPIVGPPTFELAAVHSTERS